MSLAATDSLLDLPGSAWPGRIALAALVAASGFGLALLTAMYPIIGLGAAGGFILVLAIVRVPEVILVLFGFALGVPYQIRMGGLPVNAADGLLVLWWLCIPFMALYRGRLPMHIPTVTKVTFPFVIAVLVSVVMASDPPGQYKQFLRVVEWYVVMPMALCVFATSPRLFRTAAVLLLVIPCVFAIDGMVEMLTHGRSLSGMIGIPVPKPEDTSRETIHHTFDVSGRAGSTFGGAQGLAIFLASLISIGLAHLLRPPSRGMLVLAVISVAITIGGLVVADSRGGFLGAAAAFVVMAAVLYPTVGRVLLVCAPLAVGSGVVVLAMLPGWDGSIATLIPGQRAAAVLDRLEIWRAAFAVWSEHPFTGVGLANFRDHAMQRQINLEVPLGYESFHAHNTYIEVLVDTGLLGLACYIFFLVATFVCLTRRWRALRGDRGSVAATLTLAGFGALTACMVFAFVDMLLLENLQMHLMLMLSFALFGSTTDVVTGTEVRA